MKKASAQKILFLGASHMQLPPIRLAKKLGYHVVTCDYLPANPGHQYADESYNVSTTDLDKVLALARDCGINAVIDYGSDPAAATAAYVAEKLGLAGNPYESVKTLTNKQLFRKFLSGNGFNCPQFFSTNNLVEGERLLKNFQMPAMVKPVDSSGSKGVTKIETRQQFAEAFRGAMKFSRSSKVIIEEYLPRKGYQIAGDGFIVNGQLVFRCFGQEHFDNDFNPFAPIGESFPLLLEETLQARIHNEIQKVINKLSLKRGALNFDIMVDGMDRIFLLEIGPRAGGHFISEVIKYCTDVNLVSFILKSALGKDCNDLKMENPKKFVTNYAFRTKQDGLFRELLIPDDFRANILEKHIFVNIGDQVFAREDSTGLIGCIILQFESSQEMLNKMDSITKSIKVLVD